MYEWNDRLEEDYRRYVGDKWMRGLSARDREGYRQARAQWQRIKVVGDRFRDGMALIRGQTPERGYEKEIRYNVPGLGARIIDVGNKRMGIISEYKSGRIDKEKTLPQLEKEAYLMSQGFRSDWTVVSGARVDREVQEKITQLKARFPRQFTIQEVSREQLRQALTVAKHLEKVKAREAREKARLERARDERARREVRQKENEARKKEIARVVSENVKAIELVRAEGKVFPARELSEAHKSVTRALRKVRRQDKVQGRELVAGLGLTGERARAMEETLERGRERQREGVTRGIEAIGRESRDREAAEHEARKEAERQAKQRELDARRRELVRQGLIREDLAQVLDVNDKALGRWSDPIPRGLEDVPRLKSARERGGLERSLYRER